MSGYSESIRVLSMILGSQIWPTIAKPCVLIWCSSKTTKSLTKAPIISCKMATNGKHKAERIAVVTGANKGIGFETVRQLGFEGITVVLTARDEKRGIEAKSLLHQMGLSDRVVFHQLDVLDPLSIQSLADFVKDRFGRLDILVNNAGASGLVVDEERLRALNIDPTDWLAGKVVNLIEGVIKHNYEKAQECLNTNYYGVKRVTEALLPLLQLSPAGARIVNVSSLRSELKRIPSESIRNELGDIENLTEEKVDAILKRFLHDFKENALEANGWPLMLPAYSMSKVTLNAYTRILAKKYNNMYVNCVHPGFVNTDINWHTGTLTLEEGAAGPVKLALIPDGGPTGCYFDRTEVADF
ncbi:(+)-neomenthol dehydrogenase [Ziziphus jujuba]|uniref:(+)-neomenthol dehydrogenase n=1 Tax=Ziziphus jujuba TaxID=326968 RepID=A0A6P3Z7P1_ZIZJJ|nr:(+)-neomenthol dehydrogenase [Ziziphus jujuba]